MIETNITRPAESTDVQQEIEMLKHNLFQRPSGIPVDGYPVITLDVDHLIANPQSVRVEIFMKAYTTDLGDKFSNTGCKVTIFFTIKGNGNLAISDIRAYADFEKYVHFFDFFNNLKIGYGNDAFGGKLKILVPVPYTEVEIQAFASVGTSNFFGLSTSLQELQVKNHIENISIYPLDGSIIDANFTNIYISNMLRTYDVQTTLTNFTFSVSPIFHKQDIILNCTDAAAEHLLNLTYESVTENALPKPHPGDEYLLRFENVNPTHDCRIVLPLTWSGRTCENSVVDFVVPANSLYSREVSIVFYTSKCVVVVR